MARALLAFGFVAVLVGCAHVAPYQRAKLASPTMSTRNLSEPAEAHMHAIHEGATGGTSAAEGGCGCN